MSRDRLSDGALPPARSPRAPRRTAGAPPRTAILRRSNRCIEFLAASEPFLATLGLNADHVIGRPLDDVFDACGAQAVEDLVARCLALGRKVRAADVECVAPGIVIVDVVAKPLAKGSLNEVELRLEATDTTRDAYRRLAGSLFEPTSERFASMLYVTDLGSKLVRAFNNNLSPQLGLGNAYTLQQFDDISHPEDNARVAEYKRRRATIPDHEHLTLDKRVMGADGQWRIVSSRGRVLSRNPDGSPAKIVGLGFDSSWFHMVHDALAKAGSDLARAEAREREHLGRELHDSTSQLLVGAQLILGSLHRGREVDELDRAKLDEARAAISAALAEVRAFSFLLHPPDLKALGLTRALEGLCQGFGRRVDLPIHFAAEGAIARQRDGVEMALFRIAQEALMNVHRHAQANRAEVRLRQLRNQLQLEVVDDGVGIASMSGRHQTLDLPGVGIAGMRARMANLGGEVLLENRNPGLRVLARLQSAA
jgi:hypothetical protein